MSTISDFFTLNDIQTLLGFKSYQVARYFVLKKAKNFPKPVPHYKKIYFSKKAVENWLNSDDPLLKNLKIQANKQDKQTAKDLLISTQELMQVLGFNQKKSFAIFLKNNKDFPLPIQKGKSIFFRINEISDWFHHKFATFLLNKSKICN